MRVRQYRVGTSKFKDYHPAPWSQQFVVHTSGWLQHFKGMYHLNFLRLRTPRNLVLGLVTLVAAACAETVTSPGPEFQITAGAASAKALPPMQERAVIDANRITTLSVTSGSFGYFDANSNVYSPPAPALGVLNHVHVKFCKDSYKDYGLKQFSANFHYSNVKIDSEADNEVDSPLDPDDAAHKQVNWDRSAASSILKGGGEGSFKFTGIPAGASLEVHYNYRDAAGKNFSIKTCTTVLAAPDLGVETVAWPTGAPAGVPTLFESAVNFMAFSSIPATASCAIYENGVLLGKSAVVNAGQMCPVTLTFTQAGVHNLTVKLEDIGPSDSNPTNNTATGQVIVRGGTPPPGGDGTPPGSTIIEARVQTPKTIRQWIDSTFVWTGTTRTASELHQEQGAPLVVIFPNISFTGPTQIIVSATTDGRVLQAPTTISGVGPCLGGTNATSAISYSVSLCNDEGSSAATLVYNINATTNSSGYTYGMFQPYGEAITFNVTIINGGLKYTLPGSMLTAAMKFDYSSPCGSGKAVQDACRINGTYSWRIEGNGWVTPASYVTGVPYTP